MARKTTLAIVAGLLACLLASAPASARLPVPGVRLVSQKPPKVSVQPASVTVEEGDGASFDAEASGEPAPSVQWEVSSNGGTSFTAIPGANSDRLTIADAKTSESGDEFRAVFTNTVGSAASKAATLTVQVLPAVTKQPASLTVEEGDTAVFEATASGFPAPTVQWELSTDGGSTWSVIRHATADRLTLSGVSISETGREYRATFENSAGHVTSEAATLTVDKAPKITKQPLSITREEGEGATFEATASGFPAPTVQWELSTDGGSTFTPIEGATSDLLTVAHVKTGENGDRYRAVFTNMAGTVTSSVVALTVQNKLVVTEQPEDVTVEVGQNASFEAEASGFPDPTVQWEVSTDAGKTFTPVAGATGDRLTVEDPQLGQSGDEYRAVFTNAAGKLATETAILTVALHHYRVLAWGENTDGQLGDGDFSQRDTPVPVAGLDFVTAVAAGRRHSLALLSDGTVEAWGAGGAGELGDGENVDSVVPVEVEGLTGVKAIAAGADFSLALLDDGTVMAWGADELGQLGDGGGEDSNVPVRVSALSDVTAIAAGGEHALALLSNGTVMAWGEGEQGQLGDGAHTNRSVPVAVKGLTDVAAIAAGGEHSLALLKDGTVKAWGSDRFGQLGDKALRERDEEEEEVSSDVPVAVESLSGVSAIAAGERFSLAELAGGTVMGWGENASGQLGDGETTQSQETPVTVSGLAGVSAISAGGEHSMALLRGGTVMAWGEDKFGELGDGSAGEASDVPVAVSGLGEVAGIAAGGKHDLAYGEPLPSVAALNPHAGPTGGGTRVTIAGAHFLEATAVHFGAASAEHFEVLSESTIVATAPAGSLGAVNVTVTTPAGTSATVAGDRFSYVPAPTVSGLSATIGPGSGETTVTITGGEFAEASAVDFGATPAESFVIDSPTSITAVSPPGSGSVEVTVTGPGGTSAAGKHSQFAYTPAVDGISPDAGLAGAHVTITGDGFAAGAGATTFKFAGKKARGVECSSSTTCTATVPAGAPGTVTVTAAVGKHQSPADPPGDLFTYE